jgi:hypothetical protein
VKAAVRTIATWTLPALVSALGARAAIDPAAFLGALRAKCLDAISWLIALVVVGLIAGGAYVTLAAFRPDPAIFAPWDRPVDNF